MFHHRPENSVIIPCPHVTMYPCSPTPASFGVKGTGTDRQHRRFSERTRVYRSKNSGLTRPDLSYKLHSSIRIETSSLRSARLVRRGIRAVSFEMLHLEMIHHTRLSGNERFPSFSNSSPPVSG